MKKRITRVFDLPDETPEGGYALVNRTTGEIKLCQDPITLFQTMARDAADGSMLMFSTEEKMRG